MIHFPYQAFWPVSRDTNKKEVPEMEKYEVAEIVVIEFEDVDVITTSCAGTTGGFEVP